MASEKEMRTRVSHFLRDLERQGLIGAGTTLHGLRVSYAAWWKRNGANNSEVPICSAIGPSAWARTTPGTSNGRQTSSAPSSGLRTLRERILHNTDSRLHNICREPPDTLMKSTRGRGGTGRRKGLKIPRWQRRVGSSPTARTSMLDYVQPFPSVALFRTFMSMP